MCVNLSLFIHVPRRQYSGCLIEILNKHTTFYVKIQDIITMERYIPNLKFDNTRDRYFFDQKEDFFKSPRCRQLTLNDYTTTRWCSFIVSLENKSSRSHPKSVGYNTPQRSHFSTIPKCHRPIVLCKLRLRLYRTTVIINTECRCRVVKAPL